MVCKIRGRLKDVIMSGKNISSVQLQSVLLKHPALQEVAIVRHAEVFATRAC